MSYLCLPLVSTAKDIFRQVAIYGFVSNPLFKQDSHETHSSTDKCTDYLAECGPLAAALLRRTFRIIAEGCFCKAITVIIKYFVKIYDIYFSFTYSKCGK